MMNVMTKCFYLIAFVMRSKALRITPTSRYSRSSQQRLYSSETDNTYTIAILGDCK